MLADSFANVPHRRELLKAVWTGFATLIERAQVGGAEEIGYTSVMATQHREHQIDQAELRAEIERVTSELTAELELVRAEAAEKERLRAEQEARAEEAETVAARVHLERDAAQLELAKMSSALKSEIATRERVERQLEAEVRNLVPLRAQAAQLTTARSEAQNAQALAARRQREAQAAEEGRARVLAELHVAETAVQALAKEFKGIDDMISVATELNGRLSAERDALRVDLAAERKTVDDMNRVERAKRAEEKQKLSQLMQQMGDTDAAVMKEQRARIAAEQQIKNLEARLETAAVVEEERDATIASQQTTISKLEGEVNERDNSIAKLQVEAEALQRGATRAKDAENLAASELSDAQLKSKQLISELSHAREEAKIARTELDALKLSTMREVESMRSQVQKVTTERDSAIAQKEEAESSTAVWEDRVAALEADVQRQRSKFLEREATHEAHMIEVEKAAASARRSDSEAISRQAKIRESESKVLSAAVTEVEELGAVVEAMRADVARLTNDNVAYMAEVAAYEEALSCVYELHSTLDQGRTLGVMISELGGEVIDQLAAQSEQQRAIDAAARDLVAVASSLDATATFSGDVLQPLVDEAAASHKEVPLLREELLHAGLARTETLGDLQRHLDTADQERQAHAAEMAALSKTVVQEREQAAVTSQMQATQLEQFKRELVDANEELTNWRNGNIRLSNARQWREEYQQRKQGKDDGMLATVHQDLLTEPFLVEASEPSANRYQRVVQN
jgi:hypothetical protein